MISLTEVGAGGGRGEVQQNSLFASHSCQSRLCSDGEQYGIQHPSDRGGRGGQREKGREDRIPPNPLESARDNYRAEARVRHKTQKRQRKDDREGRGLEQEGLE